MEAKTSFKVNFKNGIAEITYPNIMNHSSHSTISCTSIYVPGVRRDQNECLFITSDSIYFRKENFEKHFNVLGTFFLKTQTKMFYFQNPPVLPLTTFLKLSHSKLLTLMIRSNIYQLQPPFK